MEISRTGKNTAAGEGCPHISAGGKQKGVVSGPATAAGSRTAAPGWLPRWRHELLQEAAVRANRLRTKLSDPQVCTPHAR